MSLDRKERIFYWLFVPILAAVIPALLSWQPLARLYGWAPIDECPGSPVMITITSPGDSVRVPFRETNDTYELTNTTFIVEASRPISEDYDLGLLTKGNKDIQYRLRFWRHEQRVSPTKIRKGYVHIPLDNKSSESVEAWAIVVDSESSFGGYYSDISQITSNKSLIAISEPIVINFDK
jgi:hypothetical protein